MGGESEGEGGVDDDFAQRGLVNIGAWILGRNMFGPVRGPWPDDQWRGWWGDDPPYHTPVFVLTHHERPPIEMEGDTTFHFVTGGIQAALERAKKAAGGKDVRLGGGVSTIRQYLQARLVDELQITVSPVLLGSGEHLLGGMDLQALGYECTEFVGSKSAAHYVLKKSAKR
jgi:dihydrofolate reductase